MNERKLVLYVCLGIKNDWSPSHCNKKPTLNNVLLSTSINKAPVPFPWEKP